MRKSHKANEIHQEGLWLAMNSQQVVTFLSLDECLVDVYLYIYL